jgi:circadian clock protein KaiB
MNGRQIPQNSNRHRSSPAARAGGKRNLESPDNCVMRLYVAGQSARSLAAIENLRRICDQYMSGCAVEVIDLMKNPELAKLDQIVAIPTLVRRVPPPVRRIIGDLSATEKILVTLEIEPG